MFTLVNNKNKIVKMLTNSKLLKSEIQAKIVLLFISLKILETLTYPKQYRL